jgi:hypothetical protein
MYSKNILLPLKAKNKLALSRSFCIFSHLFTQYNDIGTPKDSKPMTLQKRVLLSLYFFFYSKIIYLIFDLKKSKVALGGCFGLCNNFFNISMLFGSI